MAADYPKSFRKWAYMLPPLLVLTVILLTISSNNSSLNRRQRPSESKTQPGRKQEGKDNKTVRPEHNHPALSQRARERKRMVAKDIHARDVRDPNVLYSMQTVPRHAFVRDRDLRRAYSDTPLPIGLGQTISQPYIVAYMTEALKLKPKFKVLEIGTGSGYQAAVCAEIAEEVYTIEILEELAESAKELLKELGYRNIFAKAADGYFGWAEHGPFDSIIVTCAANFIPPPLVEQLKPGGRMILPVGSPFGAQWLVLITKDDKGKVRSKELLPVRFVPMVGQIDKAEKPPKK
jgi:protein-L-isoaspartate(D-aspartate) O-methyltransferase